MASDTPTTTNRLAGTVNRSEKAALPIALFGTIRPRREVRVCRMIADFLVYNQTKYEKKTSD